ncbi:hypothetical protein ACLMJV_20685 [Sinorhizobium meliloti]|uniref:hypothetical protein n=1 Tax=Rhizobium meliloti TaxID=382 RepID=UPI00398D35BD
MTESKLDDFIEPLPKVLHLAWIIIPAAAYTAVLIAASIFLAAIKAYSVPIFLALLLLNIWLSASVHLKFNNGWVAALVFPCCLIASMVAVDILPLATAAEMLRGLASKT